MFAYATFGIIAGCLGDYRRLPNLVVMVTGIISIVQVSRERIIIVAMFSYLQNPTRMASSERIMIAAWLRSARKTASWVTSTPR